MPKRYPCGGLSHTAIDAMLELREEVRIADVTAIKAGISRNAAARIGDRYPTSVESAKFSMPYLAATTALYGPPLLKAFTEEAIGDPATKEFAWKVTVAVDSEYADVVEESPSRLTLTLADGRVLERTRIYASGTPQAPLTRAQVEEKFFACAERAVTRPAAARLLAILDRFEQQASLNEFLDLAKAA